MRLNQTEALVAWRLVFTPGLLLAAAVFLALAHDRHGVLHFNVTAHATAASTAHSIGNRRPHVPPAGSVTETIRGGCHQ